MSEDLIIREFQAKYPQIKEWLLDAKLNNIDFEEYLVEKGLIKNEEFLEFKKKVYQLPIKTFEIDEVLPRKALEKIPENIARQYKILPFDFKNDILYLGVVNPQIADLQEKIIDFIKNKYNIEVNIYLISLRDFYIHLEDYINFEDEVKRIVLDWRNVSDKKIEAEKPVSFQQETVSAEEGPVIKFFELILRKAVALKASDIHLEPLADKARIRFRLYGDLKTMVYIPKDLHFPLVNRVKILTNLRLDETRITQDGRFRAVIQGREVDFRVGILPTIDGEKVAIRILDPLIGLKKVTDLGLGSYHHEIILRNLKKPYGMVLVTGPTGSGKTTTLYALIREINREAINVVSLEDPVEYKIVGINQSQVRPEIGYTFARGLRELLRQDPDVILVGEIRDEETAELAIHSALTGHLVFSTLHTNSSIGAIPRLLDMGVKAYFLPSTLNLIIAQRLVRKLCPNCLFEKEISDDLLKEAEEVLKSAPLKYRNLKIKSFGSKGCPSCNFRGYIGRIGIFEMFEMNKELADLVLKHAGENEIFNIVVETQEFISMRLDGIIKSNQGLVSLEEVFKTA